MLSFSGSDGNIRILMKDNAGRSITVISPILLYTAIITGVHLFHSGWIAILGYHFAICVFLSIAGGWQLIRRLVSGWDTKLGLVISIVCLLAGPLVYWLWPYMHLAQQDLRSGLVAVGLAGGSWLGFVIYYCLVNPWLEELFWRGFLPSKARYPALSDFLYAGYHVFVLILFVKWIWVITAFVVLTIVGRLWRWTADKYGGLALPMLTHLLADVSVIGTAYILSFSA